MNGAGVVTRSVLDAPPAKALHEYFTRLQGLFGPERAHAICRIAAEAVRMHPDVHPALYELQSSWYASIAAGAPDFGVYTRPLYLAEVWYCWITYSRRYLIQLSKAGVFDNARHVVDLGCGAGYSTAALRQIVPDARVCGTNIAVGAQGALCSHMAGAYGFDLYGRIDDVSGTVDVVFASEYFEHFNAPLAHLREVLAREPRLLIVANTFTSPSIGHFPDYAVDGDRVPGAAASRAFNRALVNAGYRQRKLKLWNNRPAVWDRAAA